MRPQVIDREVHQVTTYPDADSFCEADITPAGVLSIREGGIPLDVMHSPKGADITIVFLHGAIEKHFTLPVLSGLGISGGLEANRIFISDPSLYLNENLALSWYAGSTKQDTQGLVTRVVGKILAATGSSKVVFFGGSGGGFASLLFAAKFPGSTALVFNPQTNIRKYDSPAVHAFTGACFGIDRLEYDPLTLLPTHVVTDVCKLYSEPLDVTVAYMQNLRDLSHVNRHFGPFVDSLHPGNRMLVLADSWDDGHKPPPKNLLTAALTAVAGSDKANRSIDESLLTVGFERLR